MLTTFDKVFNEFSASLVKESVGRTYAADSEEEAEWDGFFGVVWVARCLEEVLMFVCDLQLTVFIPKDFAKTIARANESYTLSFSSNKGGRTFVTGHI